MDHSSDQDGQVTAMNGVSGHPSQQQQQQQQQQQPLAKRPRVLLSCAPCRQSKLKCDRAEPCRNCVKKDRVDLCVYSPRPKKPERPTKGMRARLQRLEGMLREIMDDRTGDEDGSGVIGGTDLVGGRGMSGFGEARVGVHPGAGGVDDALAAEARMAADRFVAAAAADPSGLPTRTGTEIGPAGKGRVVIGRSGMTYVGATHFMAMLDDIEDLKNYFENPRRRQDDGDVGDGYGESHGDGYGDSCGDGNDAEGSGGTDEDAAAFAFGGDEADLVMVDGITGQGFGGGGGGGQRQRAGFRSKADLLAVLPDRAVVDGLIMQYFSANVPSQSTVHRQAFTRRYNAFWQDPSSVKLEWLAFLLMAMALGVHVSSFQGGGGGGGGGQSRLAEQFRLYRSAAAAALVASGLSKPNVQTVQGLLLYTEAEFLVNRASQTKCWLLSAVCIRLMLTLGFHRDASKLPNLSAFDGEMRRRLWNLSIQLDLIMSFHLGLPSMIHGIPSDTSLPLNLRDDDFDEDSPALPPPRPDAEYTPMSYPIFKSMVCRVFGQVARLAHSLTPPAYAEVLRTDALLWAKWRAIPGFMKVRPLGESVTDPPILLVQRFGLASLFQKSRCVLHRPFLAEAVPHPEHDYSRRAALHAAFALLAYQEAIHNATQPGRPLQPSGWFFACLGMHDFLLAAMIVYLVVQNDALFDEHDMLTIAIVGAAAGSSANEPVSNAAASAASAPWEQHDFAKSIPGGDSSSTPATSIGKLAAASKGIAYATPSSSSLTTSTIPTPIPTPATSSPTNRSGLFDLLHRSHLIWEAIASEHPEVQKAADVLAAMLERIKVRRQPSAVAADATSGNDLDGFEAVRIGPDGGVGTGSASAEAANPTVPDGQLQLLLNESFGQAFAPPLQADFPLQNIALPSNPHDYLLANSSAPVEAWIPTSLESFDWDSVDVGLRTSTGLTADSDWIGQTALDGIEYIQTGLWDHPDATLQ